MGGSAVCSCCELSRLVDTHPASTPARVSGHAAKFSRAVVSPPPTHPNNTLQLQIGAGPPFPSPDKSGMARMRRGTEIGIPRPAPAASRAHDPQADVAGVQCARRFISSSAAPGTCTAGPPMLSAIDVARGPAVRAIYKGHVGPAQLAPRSGSNMQRRRHGWLVTRRQADWQRYTLPSDVRWHRHRRVHGELYGVGT